MQCARCQHQNRPGAKFCEECAVSLQRSCAHCGSSVPESAKFCPECAHPIANPEVTAVHARPSGRADSGAAAASGVPSQIPPEGDRRQATILFADISGYTTLCATMDAEQVQLLLSRFYETTDGIIESHGGHILDHAGDATMAVFGAPVAHGNDPERAVRAALDMHAASGQITAAGRPLRLHIGIASGEVVGAVIAGGAQRRYAVTGEPANLAARLDALAQPGETLISEALHRAVSRVADTEALGERQVKGFNTPVQVWRVRRLLQSAAELHSFVGRQTEMRQLTAALDVALETGVGSAVLVRGDAGIGKSRLVKEMRMRAQRRGYDCHAGHVLDFGVGKGQDAIPIVLKGLLQVDEPADEPACRTAVARALRDKLIGQDDEALVNDLLDIEQPGKLRSVFDAMDNATRTRRSAETVAAIVKRASATRPRLLIVENIHWASAPLLRHLALLTMLTAECPLVLVMTSRFEGDPLDKLWRASTRGAALMTVDLGPLRAEEARLMAGDLIKASNSLALNCIERAEGNPLFLEQLLRSARESESANIPASIQSLVLARMDRLGAHDKQALQAASVIGKRFSLDALGRLTGEPDYRCEALIASDLVRPEGADFLFAHALIHEGVYSSLLNSKKKELHCRAAEWFGDREPILRAEHLDRAGDPGAAQAYLGAATEQAARSRYDAALHLAERGAELTAVGPERYALTMLRADVLREIGRSQDSIAAFLAALDLAENEVQRCHAWMGIAAGNRVTGEFAVAMEALARAQPIAESLGLAIECSRIHHTRGNLFFAQGNVIDCRGEHEAALAHAELAGDLECEAHALSGMGDAEYAQGRMLTALGYFERCVELCERSSLIKVEVPNRAMVAHCLHYNNELDRAACDLEICCEVARRVGLVQGEILARETLGFIRFARGEYEAAEAALSKSLSLARAAGARRYQAANLYMLALVRLAQRGRSLQVEEYLGEALELSRQTGMGFLGPAIFGARALAAENAENRRHALQEGESLLRQHCVGHCYFWFYRDAIEACVAADDWTEVLRYAGALEAYSQPEPLPWARLNTARARVLAAIGMHGATDARLNELRALREEAERARLGSMLPAIDAVLAGSMS